MRLLPPLPVARALAISCLCAGCTVERGGLGGRSDPEPDGGSSADGRVSVDGNSLTDGPMVSDGLVTGDGAQADAPSPRDGSGDARRPECTVEPPTCTDGVATVCEAGRWVVRDCPLGCSGSDAGECAVLVPSHLPADTLDPSAGDLEITENITFETTVCARAGFTSSVVMRSDGTEACVVRARNVELSEDATLTLIGERPFALVATGTVTIDGTVDGSARGTTPGPGGAGGGPRGQPGGGPAGGSAGESVYSYDDSGGGGGGGCGRGGAGGDGGSASGGTAGDAVADPLAAPPVGGSGGGGGSDRAGGHGGAGGGVVQISAGTRLSVHGTVLAGGGKGQRGLAPGDTGGGGGGGAGGVLLLEAPDVVLMPGALRAIGGGGGGAAHYESGEGMDGQDGADAGTRALGGPGASTGGGAGGDSGGGMVLDGEPGDSTGNGGGGGGGAGCIVIRTADGNMPDGAATVSSPSVAPGLVSAAVRRE